MGTEIERKFLLKDDSWRSGAVGLECLQGYLSTRKERLVRVRTIGPRGFITIKGIATGLSRTEYEYEIPLREAHEILEGLCVRPLIEKTRYRVEFEGLVWEIDEFHGENQGLVIAEVEMKDEEQAVPLPEWIGEEVSQEPRYFNSNLVSDPYRNWAT